MANKVTWLFNGYAGGFANSFWGFSESWYSDLTGDNLLNAMDVVSQARVRMLSTDSAIVGYRIQVAGGRSFVIKRQFTASRGNGSTNIPVDSALCQVTGGGIATIKRFFVHDLPDSWIVESQLDPARRPLFRQFCSTLVAQNFQMRYLTLTAPQAPVLSVDAAGNVVTTANVALVANDLVQFQRARDNNGKPIKGRFVVDAVTDPTHFHVAHWGAQVVGRSGIVRKIVYGFTPVGLRGTDTNDLTVISVGRRKVGRPFFQQRGRVPTRR